MSILCEKGEKVNMTSDVFASSIGKTSKSKFEIWMKITGIPLALVVFGLLFSMKTPVEVAVQAKMALAVFAMAFVLWVTQAVPTYVSSLIAIVALAITGAWDETSVLGVFGYDVIWLMLAAFIITSGMEKSGFAKRLALFVVSKFGSTAKKALLSLFAVNFLLAFIVPSTTARAALVLPIALMIAKVYKAMPGESNFGRKLMIQQLQVNNISTSAILTATAPQIMAVGYIRDLGGVNVSWTQWFLAGMPIALLAMVVSFFLGELLYRSEVNAPVEEESDGKELSIKDQYKALGRMKPVEIKALVIFLLTVFLWATDSYHVQMFGIQISLVMVAVISAVLFYLPYIGILNWKETKIPWDLMIFSAGAYAAGLSLDQSGAASFLLNKMFGASSLKNISPFVLFMVVIFISSFSHLIFTSKTVRTAILIPAVIAIAQQTGMNPLALALPAALTICDSITLPPHCKPNLIFYSTGYFTVANQFVYGMLVLLAKWLIMGVAFFTWFRVIHIV